MSVIHRIWAVCSCKSFRVDYRCSEEFLASVVHTLTQCSSSKTGLGSSYYSALEDVVDQLPS